MSADNNNVIAQGSPFLVWSSFVQLLTFFVILCESNMRLTGDGFTPLVIGTITILLNIFLTSALSVVILDSHQWK